MIFADICLYLFCRGLWNTVHMGSAASARIITECRAGIPQAAAKYTKRGDKNGDLGYF